MKIKFALSILFFFVTADIHAQPRQGETAPEITLADVSGNSISLSSFKGKIVLIDFWASWCAPCRQSNKRLSKLYNKYKEKGFEIFGINLDDNKKAWIRAIKSDKIKWIQVNEPGQRAKTATEWNIISIPTSFIMDKQGRLIAMNPDEKELEDYLEANL